MKKRIILIVCAVILALSMSVVALAAPGGRGRGNGNGNGNMVGGGGYRITDATDITNSNDSTNSTDTNRNSSYRPGICVFSDTYCPLWDEDGNLYDKETFESNLDKAISDGLIDESDREYFVDRYDYCVTYGGQRVGCRRR